MMKQSSLAALLALVAASDAFSACSSSRRNTALNLLPEQGKQLEAAMNAAYASMDLKKTDETFTDALPSAATTTTTTTESNPKQDKKAAARAFVSRVFSLPSSMIGRHPHPNLEGLPNFANNRPPKSSFSFSFSDNHHHNGGGNSSGNEKDDVVLFPLVGFQFVQDGPNHYRVLPTQSNPSCRLRDFSQNKEELVGWFSCACHLDLFSDNYAAAPNQNVESN